MAVAMAVIMVMIVMVIMIVGMIVAGIEKFRFDLEDAVEIERAALQDVRQFDLCNVRCDEVLRKD